MRFTCRWGLLVVSSCGLLACSSPEDKKTEETNGFRELAVPENGFQLASQAFEVAQGEEVQDCYFFEVPGTEPVYVNKITFSQKTGSHHMNVFRVNTVLLLDGQDGDVVHGGECWKSGNWSDWPIVANSQLSGVEDWQLPEGVAHKFEPGEKLMLQTHYVNATTQDTPEGAKAMVNFYGMDASKVTAELGTLFATDQNLRVCPGDVGVSTTATCLLGGSEPVHIAAANGHFHSRGTRFTMNVFDEVTSVGERFYDNRSWDDPDFERDLDVTVPAGGGVTWTCEFAAPTSVCGDPADSCCFNFGGHVETQEHCNAFVYYWPKGNTSKNCF